MPEPRLVELKLEPGMVDPGLFARAVAKRSTAPRFRCPRCGSMVDSAPAANGLVRCARCYAEFFAVAELSEEDRAEAERSAAEVLDRQQRLSDIHIKQIVVERRYQFRTRSYHVVALGVALALIYHLVDRLIREVRWAGWSARPLVCLGSAIVLMLFVRARWRSVRALNAALASPLADAKSQSEPATAPDFSTLSDGSQSWKNLERMHGSGEPNAEPRKDL